ncbi:response regulator [Maribacter sp. 2307ULW6-5]|uniref:response regulator n=1 Tax=Maribacter sp. 2307ULW6-5 TaxID=3386275 RepID=UPI0039BC3BB5
MHIYLADDDADDRQFFVDALQELPLRSAVHHFDDGIHLMAQLMIKENPLPNVVYLDINMPLMCGRECLKKIRGTERVQDLPVIIYSTSFVPREVEAFKTLGANGYLQKPNSYNQLKTLLYKSLRPFSNGTNTCGVPFKIHT